MHSPEIKKIIDKYKLEAHPEGGYFKESYRSHDSFKSLPEPFNGDRNYSTAIYFLMPQGKKSSLHKIASDEVWHFYLGGPMTIYQISPDGALEIITLGQDILKGEKLQHVVPAGYWFGGHTNSGSDYSFVGCTVAPGFDFNDFVLADRTELSKLFPQHIEVIEKLT
ncbi:cupin domain-containing protein [Halobacteriovorax sp. ZH4_bin.1]|uniref:cupin domain-containing protein n=1 Tax=unclassified Halobacteriovorax TaxID=2639665 RepID=UPI003713F03D